MKKNKVCIAGGGEGAFIGAVRRIATRLERGNTRLKKRLLLVVVLVTSLASPVFAQDLSFKVLLFTKTEGFRHESIFAGIAAIRTMASKHHFGLDWHETSSQFNSKNLEQYQAVIFLNTTGDILNNQEQQALEKVYSIWQRICRHTQCRRHRI